MSRPDIKSRAVQDVAARDPLIGSVFTFSIRAEPCACGGVIHAGGQAVVVATAIDRHNQTPRHQAWRERNEVSHGDESGS